ncbi:energy transducer TonB [Hydrogenimonas sp.]
MILVVVALVEAAVIYYTRITPRPAPAPQAKKVAIHICGCRPRPEPRPPVVHPKPPEPVVKPEPPKPKPKPKPKSKPKKKKPVKKPTPKPTVVKKVVPPTPEPPKAPPPPPAPVALPAPVAKAPAAAPVDTAAIERAKADYLAKIRAAIEAHKYYPRISRKMRQTGTVEVQFTILPDGTIKSIEVLAPCRHKKLNKAAVRTLEKIGRFPPIPEKLDVSELSICVPIRYTLK